MVDEETKPQAAGESVGEKKSPPGVEPLDTMMKAQIDQEVDAAFKDAPAKSEAAATKAAGPSDEAASDAEAHDILMQEVTDRAAEAPPETAQTAAAEASADRAAPPEEKIAAGDEAMAAGRAAAAEATSAAEREGLMEKPAEQEKPKRKERRAEAESNPEAEAKEVTPGAISQMAAKVLDMPGRGLATLLEMIDKPLAWVGPEIRSIFGVVALVTIGLSVVLIILRFARVI